MALLGVFGDIHGNREALAAALAALERRGAPRSLCLGDIVGYNADPDECVELVRSRCVAAIAGNHDLIGLGRIGFGSLSNRAEYSLKRTRRTLARDSAQWLAALPSQRLVDGDVLLVHGPLQNAVGLRADYPGARVCFFGHGDEPQLFVVDGDAVTELAAEGKVTLEEDKIYFVNPGAVDAQRKHDHKLAECALFDSTLRTVEFIRCRYDCAATEAKAMAFGYRINPLTDRLYSLRRRISAKF